MPTDKRRPITADEIQKAKLRAQFLQSNKTKTDGPKRPSLLTSDFLSASEAYLRPKLEAQKKARLHPPTSSKQVNSSSDQKLASDQKPAFDQKEHLLDKCRRVQIPWRAPPGTVSSNFVGFFLCISEHSLQGYLILKGIVFRISSTKGNNHGY